MSTTKKSKSKKKAAKAEVKAVVVKTNGLLPKM